MPDPGNGDGAGFSKARFLRWEIVEPRSEPANFVTAPGPVRVKFTVEVLERLRAGQLSIALFTAGSDLVWAWASEKTELEPGVHDLLVTFPYLPLRPGSYTWDPALWDDGAELDHDGERLCRVVLVAEALAEEHQVPRRRNGKKLRQPFEDPEKEGFERRHGRRS